MPMTTADKRTIFRKMHESGCFVLPNPWDVGSARALQHLGFKAIASTSADAVWLMGFCAGAGKLCWLTISMRPAAEDGLA